MDQESQDTPEASSPKASPFVHIENGDKKAETTIQNIDGLFQGIKDYNRQFSVGGSLATMLQGLLKIEDDVDSDQPPGPASKPDWMKGINQDQQYMSASALDAMHETTLTSLGLGLEPVSGKATTIFGPGGEQVGTGEMRLNIKDRNQFTAFLHALKPEQITETPLGGHLGDLTGILSKQILDNYDLDQPSDSALAFLGGLDGIVTEYKRLGLNDQAKQMEEYLQHSRAGNLKEFVALKTSGLMQEPGKGFGPADWQKDTSPESLRNRWTEALQLLRALRNNPNAEQMYKQLYKQLEKCLPIGMAYLQGVKSYSGYYTPEYKQQLLDELKTAEEGLSSFEI